MKLFGFEHHHHESPWDEAPPWAIELRCMLGQILDNQAMEEERSETRYQPQITLDLDAATVTEQPAPTAPGP